VAPRITEVRTVTISLEPTGPEQADDPVTGPCRLLTLADVEDWCAALRGRGCAGEKVIDGTPDLSVTLDLTGQQGRQR
jgi:hypothetical protein